MGPAMARNNYPSRSFTPLIKPMHWIAPSQKDAANGTLEEVFGLSFLRFAEVRSARQVGEARYPEQKLRHQLIDSCEN